VNDTNDTDWNVLADAVSVVQTSVLLITVVKVSRDALVSRTVQLATVPPEEFVPTDVTTIKDEATKTEV